MLNLKMLPLSRALFTMLIVVSYTLNYLNENSVNALQYTREQLDKMRATYVEHYDTYHEPSFTGHDYTAFYLNADLGQAKKFNISSSDESYEYENDSSYQALDSFATTESTDFQIMNTTTATTTTTVPSSTDLLTASTVQPLVIPTSTTTNVTGANTSTIVTHVIVIQRIDKPYKGNSSSTVDKLNTNTIINQTLGQKMGRIIRSNLIMNTLQHDVQMPKISKIDQQIQAKREILQPINKTTIASDAENSHNHNSNTRTEENPIMRKATEIINWSHYFFLTLSIIGFSIKVWLCIHFRSKLCCYGCSPCKKCCHWGRNTRPHPILNHETVELNNVYV